MSTDSAPLVEENPSATSEQHAGTYRWLLRRICSQNPFYLLSVCFVLHGTARWFNGTTGVAFSPWPLLGLTAGYTLLLAATGFVIVRFGHVWDDARSILLMILLMFVQLTLIFDETLVQDASTGRLLLLTCWTFSVVVSEGLLLGLRINLPWRFRVTYHTLIALLFFYPLALISDGTRLATETVQWRIFLFPSVAALIALTLIPAIRQGNAHTRNNGTPWVWPWYPWSLFVFLGIGICFRAYALSQSFDPVLTESTQSAMSFASAFGVYFLVPLIFAMGLLLLEAGIVEWRRGVVRLAMFVPMLCVILSVPSSNGSGPYWAFLQILIDVWGSPVWLTLLGAVAYYGIAIVRGVRSAEQWMAITLLFLTRVGPRTLDWSNLASLDGSPLLAMAVIELLLGLVRHDSRRVFIALCSATVGLNFVSGSSGAFDNSTRLIAGSLLLVISFLVVGAVYRDDFARFLRIVGAPLLVIVTIAGCILIERTRVEFPIWTGPAFVVVMTLVALSYAAVVDMRLYQLSSLVCGLAGSAVLTEMMLVHLIRESAWRGATSFASGIGCLILAAMISSWKAGWLARVVPWLRSMLVLPQANTA